LSSYSKNIELHLNSFVWISKIVADQMIKKKIKNGSIINLASIYGILGQDPSLYKNINSMSESLTYPVIKGGIINSCKSMAAYYAKFNIRVNCVSPGGIFDNQNKKFVERYIKKTPLNRMGTTNDLVGPILFLASEDSNYITGINLVVDGGYSII
jgi:NAD(P)-dependent dehydrogenase (short-subunit alcohol dehydrogenase family)